jgi:hypothetical protein
MSAILSEINKALLNENTEFYYASDGGYGCIFRDQTDLDYFTSNDTPAYKSYKVLPASFLHHDIISPNPVYNLQKNPPPDGTPCVGTLAYDPVKVKNFYGGNNIQDTDNWNDCVLYPYDSNSCDFRAIFLKDGSGWQGPCMWDKGNNNRDFDPKLIGSGQWPQGNPETPGEEPSVQRTGNGGGSGYHTINNWKTANQNKDNYKVGITDCTAQIGGKIVPYCDYYEKINYRELNPHWYNRNKLNEWDPFIKAWKKFADDPNHSNITGWDTAHQLETIGWVDEFRALISLQNALWMYRTSLNFSGNKIEAFGWRGWNEIPIDANNLLNPGSWDCLAIVLPLNQDGDYAYKDLKFSQKQYIFNQVQKYLQGMDVSGIKYDYTDDIAVLRQVWDPNYECASVRCRELVKVGDLLK